MGVGIGIINLDRKFATLSREPILVNDFDISSDESREELNQLIYTHYEGDTLGTVPQCQCGQLTGVYQIGSICGKCNTEVGSVTERELEPVLWVEAPEGVNTLMNPQMWVMLSQALRYGSLNILEHLCNPNLPLPPTLPKEAQRYLQLKIPRGINYFHANFDQVMELLFQNNLVYANRSRQYREEFAEFIRLNRDCIFCRHLPCPSRISLITERTVTSSYAEPTMPLIVDAILTISNVVNSTRPLSLEVRQARATEAIRKFSEYHEEVKKNVLFRKEGWARKHLFGSRLHWTFRGVITSLSENHERDELHLPWSMAVMLLEVHLWNKLLKLNYTPSECTTFINESILQYNPLIDSLFDELIAESPMKGLPVLFGRNPWSVNFRAFGMKVP